MQGQNGYVNGYVVIFLDYYIICCEDGRMGGNVTRASPLALMGRYDGG